MATSDPWASLFLKAAGEAPPESKADKILSKDDQVNSTLAINNFLYDNILKGGGQKKRYTFNQNIVDQFKCFFGSNKLANEKRTNKIVKIKNVLPNDVALGALEIIKGTTDKQWQLATQKTDKGSGGSNKYADGAGSTAHRYEVGDGQVVNKSPFAWRSSKDVNANNKSPLVIKALCDCMKNLLPANRIGIFQAGKYTRGCFIEPHDDVAYKDIVDPHGVTRRYERDIAVIYYLTKDWHYELGGNFIDLSIGGTTHTPQFNSLVAFTVPRLHEVDVMKTDRSRITIFGWFYKLANNTANKKVGAKNSDHSEKIVATRKRKVNVNQKEGDMLHRTKQRKKRKKKKKRKKD